MTTHEFACPKCLETGQVTLWEADFESGQEVKSLCPVCESEGNKVFLTPPHVIKGEQRSKTKFSEKLLREEMDNRGLTSVRQKQLETQASPRGPWYPRAIGMKETLSKAQDGALRAAAEADAMHRMLPEAPSIIGRFPKKLPTNVVGEVKE